MSKDLTVTLVERLNAMHRRAQLAESKLKKSERLTASYSKSCARLMTENAKIRKLARDYGRELREATQNHGDDCSCDLCKILAGLREFF